MKYKSNNTAFKNVVIEEINNAGEVITTWKSMQNVLQGTNPIQCCLSQLSIKTRNGKIFNIDGRNIRRKVDEE